MLSDLSYPNYYNATIVKALHGQKANIILNSNIKGASGGLKKMNPQFQFSSLYMPPPCYTLTDK